MPYVYCLVRRDLSLSQQVVQTSHAVIEACSAFQFDNLPAHPHLVVCGVNDEGALLRAQSRLDRKGVKFKVFCEADLDGQVTALCSEPLFGDDRKAFRPFQLLTIKEPANASN